MYFKEINKLQDKVIFKIIYIMDDLDIEIKNSKIEAYAKYLSERTSLKYQRLNNILNINVKRRITINEVYIISIALNVPLSELFNFKDIENTNLN